MINLLLSFFIVAFGQPAFVPFFGLLAAVFGYALFWKLILEVPSKKKRFFISLLWFAAVQAVQLSWMSTTDYQGFYIHFVHAILAFFLGLQFAFFVLFIKKDNSILAILALSSFWTLLEWGRFFFFCGFSFNPAGLALSGYLWPLQMASIWGILGLSFWVVFINLMVLRAFYQKKWKSSLTAITLALFPYIWGVCHLSYHDYAAKKCDKSLSILLVQTGLLPSEKITLAGRLKEFVSPYLQWRRLLEMIKEKGAADLIVLPEAAVPFTSELPLYSFKRTEKILTEFIGGNAEQFFPEKWETKKNVSNSFWAQTLSNYLNSDVIIGLDYKDPSSNLNYNSAFLFKPYALQDRYDKRVLIPLAEYLPFQWLYPLVESYGITDFFTQGKKISLFKSCVPISVSICYEETFPNIIREGRANGAGLLVNLTNDGWYPRSKLAKQHFDLARLRAVENGVASVRSCNTGITGALDSRGRILGTLPEFDSKNQPFSGVLKIQINPYHYPTLYTFWGNWGILSVCYLFILIFIRQFKWGKYH